MFVYRIISILWVLYIMIMRRIKKIDDINDSKAAKNFIKYSNKFWMKHFLRKKISGERVLLLLPHCLQNYECKLRVTNEILNCSKCGKCKIGSLPQLIKEYKINVKIVTGGTLARKIVKEVKPKLIIAVACERDLVTGVFDVYPMPVYAIFNKREFGPCINTDMSIEEIEQVLCKILSKGS